MYLHSLRACPQDRLLTRLKQYNNRVLVSCKLSSHFPPFCQKLFLCNCTSPQNFSNVHKSSLATMLTYFERYGSETLHSFFQRSWAKETAHTAMTLLIYLLISGLNSFVRLFVFFFFLHFFSCQIGSWWHFLYTDSIPGRWYFSLVVPNITSLSEAVSCFCTEICRKLIKCSLSTSISHTKTL